MAGSQELWPRNVSLLVPTTICKNQKQRLDFTKETQGGRLTGQMMEKEVSRRSRPQGILKQITLPTQCQWQQLPLLSLMPTTFPVY